MSTRNPCLIISILNGANIEGVGSGGGFSLAFAHPRLAVCHAVPF
jgi:hypothetical protein